MLRQARTSASLSQEQISSIAQKFFNSVRSHNKLKRAHSQSQCKAECRTARHQCHKNLWKFTKKLLDGDGVSDIQPTFSEAEATSFFTSVYHSEPRSYTQPSWMPAAPGPVTEFNEDDISVDEIAYAVKKSRSKSSPSPVDGIPYLVFKKCPALLVALHNIFNLRWTSSTVPSVWKLAAVRLIAKPSAKSDPSSPTNFRPIALTSSVGKLFSTILRNRWLRYMLTNQYFDKSVQKAFMPTTPGCTEHHRKLVTIMNEAKRKH